MPACVPLIRWRAFRGGAPDATATNAPASTTRSAASATGVSRAAPPSTAAAPVAIPCVWLSIGRELVRVHDRMRRWLPLHRDHHRHCPPFSRAPGGSQGRPLPQGAAAGGGGVPGAGPRPGLGTAPGSGHQAARKGRKNSFEAKCYRCFLIKVQRTDEHRRAETATGQDPLGDRPYSLAGTAAFFCRRVGDRRGVGPRPGGGGPCHGGG